MNTTGLILPTVLVGRVQEKLKARGHGTPQAQAPGRVVFMLKLLT